MPIITQILSFSFLGSGLSFTAITNPALCGYCFFISKAHLWHLSNEMTGRQFLSKFFFSMSSMYSSRILSPKSPKSELRIFKIPIVLIPFFGHSPTLNYFLLCFSNSASNLCNEILSFACIFMRKLLRLHKFPRRYLRPHTYIPGLYRGL